MVINPAIERYIIIHVRNNLSFLLIIFFLKSYHLSKFLLPLPYLYYNILVMKTCARCKISQPIDEFGIDRKRKDGRFCYCKTCRSIENKLPHIRERQRLANIKHRQTPEYKKKVLLHDKRYRNSKKGKVNRKEYVKKNAKELKKYMKEYAPVWQKTPQGCESLRKARQKNYYKDVEKSREYQRKHYYKRKQKIEYRINDAVSSSIYCALKNKKNGRSWESFVGYTLADLMCHLESLFVDGMSWNNYGSWHIDHVIPRCKFSVDEIQDCWKLSNLQPLWAEDNMSKHASF